MVSLPLNLLVFLPALRPLYFRPVFLPVNLLVCHLLNLRVVRQVNRVVNHRCSRALSHHQVLLRNRVRSRQCNHRENQVPNRVGRPVLNHLGCHRDNQQVLHQDNPRVSLLRNPQADQLVSRALVPPLTRVDYLLESLLTSLLAVLPRNLPWFRLDNLAESRRGSHLPSQVAVQLDSLVALPVENPRGSHRLRLLANLRRNLQEVRQVSHRRSLRHSPRQYLLLLRALSRLVYQQVSRALSLVCSRSELLRVSLLVSRVGCHQANRAVNRQVFRVVSQRRCRLVNRPHILLLIPQDSRQ